MKALKKNNKTLFRTENNVFTSVLFCGFLLWCLFSPAQGVHAAEKKDKLAENKGPNMEKLAEQMLEEQKYLEANDKAPPKTTVVTDRKIEPHKGVYYVSFPTDLKLTAIDSLAGVKQIQYSKDGKNFLPYNPKTFLEPMTNKVFFRSIDLAGNVEPTQTLQYVFFPPKPKTEINIDPPPFEHEDTFFLQPTTVFTLSSDSGLIPVKETVLFIDNIKKTYTKPFSFSELGTHEFLIYTVDWANNREEEIVFNVVIDDKPPLLSISFEGNSVDLDRFKVVQRDFRIMASSSDEGSGVKEIRYHFEKNQAAPFPYTEPIRLFEDGYYGLTLFASDRVNNLSNKKKIYFMLDSSPPLTTPVSAIPFTKIDGDWYSTYPNTLMFHSKDNLSGVQSILVSHDSSEFVPYLAPLPLKRSRSQKVAYKAIDRMGNEEETKTLIIQMPVDDHKVTVAMISAEDKIDGKKTDININTVDRKIAGELDREKKINEKH